jgi:O-antigen/teichoic acid export membrane protein
VWWLLPVLAVAFSIGAWVLGPTPGGHAAAAIAGLELAAWALDRRAGLSRALLPTDAPYWLDRAVTAGAFTVGVVAAGVAIAGLFGAIRHPPRSREVSAP